MNFIYVFSQFTNELLIFESILIFFFLTWYAAHFILVKRKMAALNEAVPAGVVKVYLNELIGEAQSIREQLFGLIGQAGISLPHQVMAGADGSTQLMQLQAAANAAAEKISDNPAMQRQLAALQAQLAQQMNAIQHVEKEKKDLESQLLNLKANSGKNTGAAGPNNSAELDELRKRVKSLQERLDEYSVIEDDLANLKRLQQENENLKSQLTGGPAAPTPAKAPVPQATASEPSPTVTAAAVSSPIAAAAEPEATSSSDAPGLQEGDFEGLVSKVEQSLAQGEPEPTASVNSATKEKGFDMLDSGPKKSESPPSSKPASPEAPSKSDEDLLSEFEKMLNM